MENHKDLRLLSVKLYHYLSDVVVGSEKMVKYRRYFYKCFDDCLYEGDNRMISSGSKAEGLDLPGSDLDLMSLSFAFIVDEKQGNTKEKHLILDTDNALPGFALIKVTDDSDLIDHIDVSQTVNGLLLQNSYLKQTRLQAIEKDPVFVLITKTLNMDVQTLLKVQGPAMTTAVKGAADVDLIHCLPCREWPSIAKRWLHRNRCGKWPSSDLLAKAIHEGVLLVPVGSKSPSSEENISEWRFSFSLTEKLLVHSFNHTQLLCYALLKIFLKEIIDKINIFNKLLCSYYMKTVIFWVSEEVECSYWTQENLLRCFSSCLQRLHYFILHNILPNYFIPEHNMIEGRFSENVGKQLIEKLLIGNIWELLMSVDLLSDLRQFKCFISKPKVISEFDKTMITLNIPDCNQFIKDISSRSLSFFVYRIRNEYCPAFFKNIYAIALLDLCKSKAISIKMRSVVSQHSSKRSNKHKYSQYKQCLFHLLMNLNGDAVSGWLLLAALFYSCQEYRKMNVILSLAEHILSRDLYTLFHIMNPSAVKQTTFDKILVPYSHFLKRLRHSLIRICFLQRKEQNDDSFIFHEDLSVLKKVFSIGTPIVFIRYLQFLYFYKQNNTEGIHCALQMLKEAVEISPKLDGSSVTMNFILLVNAQLLIGDDEMELTETGRRMFFALKHFAGHDAILTDSLADIEEKYNRYLNE